MFTTNDTLAGFGDLCIGYDGPPNLCFRGAAVDSRRVQPGDLFFALKGQHTDGHLFVSDALQRGARGVVVSRAVEIAGEGTGRFLVQDPLLALQRLAGYWRNRFQRMRVIGVTGSVGKTSTKEVIAHVLSQKFQVVKNTGSLNSESGLPVTLLGIADEPEKAVLEMAMFVPGDIRLLCDIARPVVGVVTNVGFSHLERAGSIEAIAQAKAELPESLPVNGVAILNYDDPRVQAMVQRTRASILYYGLAPDAHVQARDVESAGLEGLRFTLCYAGKTVPIQTPVFGRHRLPNLLAAAAVALTEGMILEEVAGALATARVDLRLRVLPGKRSSIIIDDTYNASPASMIGALELLAELPGRRLAILGDMKELGSAAIDAHRRVGERAAVCCDLLFVVGELGHLIGHAAQTAGLAGVGYTDSKEDAIRAVYSALRPGDFVLVKASRALEFETIVAALTAEEQPV